MWDGIILILTGWLLSELTRYLNSSKNNKEAINKSAFPLLSIKLTLETLFSILKAAKDKNKFDLNDLKLFQEVWADNTGNNSLVLKKIESSLTEISKIDPLIALDLSKLVDTTKLVIEEKFVVDSIKNKDLLAINIQLKSIKLFITSLDKIIRKLLFRHSRVFLVRYLIYEYKNKKRTVVDWNKLFE